jgi:hypothetical protein
MTVEQWTHTFLVVLCFNGVAVRKRCYCLLWFDARLLL